MRARTKSTTMLTAVALSMSIALPAMASRAEPVEEARPVDVCAERPEHPRCQEDPAPTTCEREPEHPRCQRDPVPTACDRDPEHPRCQEPETRQPVDRCERLAERTRRCFTPPGPDYRQLLWRLINAGEWRMLIRLLLHLGIL